MTKFDKIKDIFLNNPESLSLKKIESFLLSEWFEIKFWKWSHKKMKKEKITFIYPVHNNETKNYYKKQFLKIYKEQALFNKNS